MYVPSLCNNLSIIDIYQDKGVAIQKASIDHWSMIAECWLTEKNRCVSVFKKD